MVDIRLVLADLPKTRHPVGKPFGAEPETALALYLCVKAEFRPWQQAYRDGWFTEGSETPSA